MATRRKRPSALGYKACSNRGARLASESTPRSGQQLVECRIVKERTGKVSEKEIARLEAQRAYLKDLRKRNAEEEAKKKKKPKKRTTAKRTTAKKTTAKKTTAKRGGKGGQMKIF